MKPKSEDKDRQIADLKSALYFARQTIMDLMPPDAREVLSAHWHCDTLKDVAAWNTWAVGKVMQMAKAKPGEQMGDMPGRMRAYCPLCGGGVQSPGPEGYAFPTGLLRHLEGSHRSHRCPVFASAYGEVRESVIERSAPGYAGPNLAFMGKTKSPWVVEAEELRAMQAARRGKGAKILPWPDGGG